MLRLNRLVQRSCSNRASVLALQPSIHEEKLTPLSSQCSAQKTSIRLLDIYQMGNKAAIEKERARLYGSTYEMSRCYFADMSELKKHGGKIAMANKIIIPAAAAVKFPDLEVTQWSGVTFKLPIICKTNSADAETSSVPKASLVCLSFRASSQAMVDSWSLPFNSAFSDAKNVHLYEVSFIDSWLLCGGPIKLLLLQFMRKADLGEKDGGVKRQIGYSFGDHYYFRKELKILNLLTGYIFLLDKFGRIRWQGFGMATEEEMSSLVSCASLLLEEK